MRFLRVLHGSYKQAITAFIRNVKSTNKIDIEVRPCKTVTISGLLKKDQRTDSEAVTEQSERHQIELAYVQEWSH